MIATSLSRRALLQRSSTGFGWLALCGMLGEQSLAGAAGSSTSLRAHHSPRAKNIVFCFMDGGPSHVDTLDEKPLLKQHEGRAIGEGAVSKLSQSAAGRVWLGSPWAFRPRGESGLSISELFPRIAQIADHLCVVRSMKGELPLHGQQNLLLHTGRIIGQAPGLGAWVSYGLGTENRNLPAYVVLNNDWVPNGGLENFGSSFLPASHQATMLRPAGVPVDNIVPSDSLTVQRRKLDLLAAQNRDFARQASDGGTLEATIANYETAFRMQRTVPEIADLSREPQYIQQLYGMDSSDEHQRLYASQALRARRLIEAGVRFVEITCPSFDGNNSPWDQHGPLKQNHEKNARVN